MVSYDLCWKLECWLDIVTTTRANRVCKSFSLSLSVYQLNCLRTSKGLSLGELIRLRRIYFSKHFCPCFGLSCMIWMELTRTDVVFSRITMVLFYVQKTNILGMTWNSTGGLRKNKKILAKYEDQGSHTLSTTVGAPPLGRAPLPRGPPGCPRTPTPTLYICF